MGSCANGNEHSADMNGDNAQLSRNQYRVIVLVTMQLDLSDVTKAISVITRLPRSLVCERRHNPVLNGDRVSMVTMGWSNACAGIHPLNVISSRHRTVQCRPARTGKGKGHPRTGHEGPKWE